MLEEGGRDKGRGNRNTREGRRQGAKRFEEGRGDKDRGEDNK